MNLPSKVLAEYLSIEDQTFSTLEIYKNLEAVKLLVAIKNTDRLVAAIEKLNNTMHQMRSQQTK